MAETEIITAVLKADEEEEQKRSNKEDGKNDELTLNKPTEPVIPSNKKEVVDANPQEAEKKDVVQASTAEANNAAENEVEGEGKVEQVDVPPEQNSKEAVQTNDSASSLEAPEHPVVVAAATGGNERPGFPLRTSLRHIGTSLKDVFTGHLPHVGVLHLAETKAAQDEEQLKRFIQRHKWDKVMELLLQQEEESLKDEFKQAAEEDLKQKKQEEAKVDKTEQEEVKKQEGEELLQSSKSFTEDEDSILKTLDDTVEDLKHKQDVNEVKLEHEHEALTETKEEKTVATKDDAMKAAPLQDKGDDKKELLSGVTIHKDNLLHLMCRHHPPACVVEKTIQLKHHLVSELNENMECPLHVATSHGASPKVVQLLIDSYPLAVSWQDDRGRTPLHGHLYECSQEHKYCCDPGHYMVEGAEGKIEEENLHHYKPLLVQGPLLDVIQHLCNQMSPDDMGLQDKFGHIPLEIAKYYDCDHITLAVIKEAM